MIDVTCARCGATFERNHGNRKYCSTQCGRRAYYERRIADGRQIRLDAARLARPRYCTLCSTRVRQALNDQPVCRACSPAHLRARDKARRRCARARVKLTRAAQGTVGRFPMVSGRCPGCGTWFLHQQFGPDPARYCTPRCRRRAVHARHEARKRKAFVEDVLPRVVFERDGWRCHICRRKVNRNVVVPHPKAATIDHLTPLALGGQHELANVRTAHFICNSMKGDRGVGDQLMLFG